MKFLNDQGFNKHLYYGLPMINDPVRNSFYKKMLESCVKNKKCIDVGFGTGILSIIACDIGAESIVAFEEDEETFYLGKWLIDKLGLSNKIELIHKSINSSDFLNDYPNIDCVFTETINSTLWGENFLDLILPPRTKPLFLPKNYFLEVHAIQVSDNFALGLINRGNKKFNPGIDINKDFFETISKLVDPNHSFTELIENHLYNIDFSDSSWIKDCQLINIFKVNNSLPANGYILDVNKQEIKFYHNVKQSLDSRQVTLKFDLDLNPSKTFLMFIRTGISFDNNKLYLDEGHWGSFPQHFIIKNPCDKIAMEHNLFDGNIFVKYKDQKICLIKEETSEKYQHIVETDKVKVIKFIK